MKRLSLFLAGSLVILAVPILAVSQWGPSGCFLPAQPAVVGAPGYNWRFIEKDGALLYYGNKQVGGWNAIRQKYQALTDFASGEWGQEEDSAPISPPGHLVRAKGTPVESHKLEPFQMQGVLTHKLATKPQHSVSGKIVSYQDGLCPKARAALTDDSGKLWLSVWSKDSSKREKVVSDLKASPGLWSWVQDRCHLYAGDAATPGHFLTVDREGQPLFAFDGDPMISLQAHDGSELWHDAGYTQGPPSLEMMRKRDPNYKPDLTPSPKNPDPKKPDDKKSPSASGGGGGGWLLLGAVAAFGYFMWPTKQE